jgi:hypothetical protein
MSTFLNSVFDNDVLLIFLVLPTQAKLRKLIGYLQMTLLTNSVHGLIFVLNDLGLLAFSFVEPTFRNIS